MVFAIRWHESALDVHVSSILNPAPTSLPIPQGHPSAPALSALSHAANLDWWSVSHIFKVVLFAQLCPTLCEPMDCSPPGFSVHGILQARILEWVAIPFFCGSFWPRDWTRSPALQVDSLPSELPGKLRFCFDPSVVSKRNFPVEQLPAIKCNPSSMLQELFLTETEKRCGKIYFFLEPLTIFGFGPEFHSFWKKSLGRAAYIFSHMPEIVGRPISHYSKATNSSLSCSPLWVEKHFLGFYKSGQKG